MLEIHVQITPPEGLSDEVWAKNLELRDLLHEVGAFTGGGAGSGMMDNWVEIEPGQRDHALARIRAALTRVGFAHCSSVKVRELRYEEKATPDPRELVSSTETPFPRANPEVMAKLRMLGGRQNKRLGHDQLHAHLPAISTSTYVVQTWMLALEQEGFEIVAVLPGLSIDRHVHARSCIARFTGADGNVGLLRKHGAPSSVSVDDDVFRTAPIWSDEDEYPGVLSAIEAEFVGEVESCIARGSVDSHAAVTAYASMWELRAGLVTDPPATGGYRRFIADHYRTTLGNIDLTWGVVRASGPSRFICPDRPCGLTFIPITRELALVAGEPDGDVDEVAVQAWNTTVRGHARFVFGHLDDLEAFSSLSRRE